MRVVRFDGCLLGVIPMLIITQLRHVPSNAVKMEVLHVHFFSNIFLFFRWQYFEQMRKWMGYYDY